MPTVKRRNHAISLQQATQESPTLARLADLATESATRLKALEPLVPRTLYQCMRPGPIEGPVWCVLLSNNAAAAKLRQLLPALEAHLRSRGWEVNAIRLRVQTPAGIGLNR